MKKNMPQFDLEKDTSKDRFLTRNGSPNGSQNLNSAGARFTFWPYRPANAPQETPGPHFWCFMELFSWFLRLFLDFGMHFVQFWLLFWNRASHFRTRISTPLCSAKTSKTLQKMPNHCGAFLYKPASKTSGGGGDRRRRLRQIHFSRR